ncbi:hypothetical protein AB6E04_16805 [Vibrio amylolyticus]
MSQLFRSAMEKSLEIETCINNESDAHSLESAIYYNGDTSVNAL